MLTISYSLPYRVLIFIAFITFSYKTATAEFMHPIEIAEKDLIVTREKITKRFTQKITTQKATLESCSAQVKKEPLYSELETAIRALKEEPSYELYQIVKETHSFMQTVENYNKTVVRKDLVKEMSNTLETLKEFDTKHKHELFSQVRSTLKKQRVALVELFEEEEFLASINKLVTQQSNELQTLLEKQKSIITELPSYLHVQDLHKKYLQTTSVKKLTASIEKAQDLITQQEIALLKNKDYQKLVNRYEVLVPTPLPVDLNSHQEFKNYLVTSQKQLFIVLIV